MKSILSLFFAVFCLCFAPFSQAQTQVAPFVNSHVQFSNASGAAPCNGCLLSTFSAGTTSPLVTYSESTGTTPNSNPVVLASDGSATIYLTNASYKFVLKTAAGATIWTQDQVTWNNLATTLSSLTLTGNATINSSTAATNVANQSGPTFCMDGNFWNGSASAVDSWCWNDVLGSGTNPTSTLTLVHSGSSGTPVFSVPALSASSATISGALSAGSLTGNFDSGPTQTITSITASGLTATVTTSGVCTVTAGDAVSITGSSVASYNTLATNSLGGTNPPMWIAQTSCSGGSTFTYQTTITGLGASSGGTLKRSVRFIGNITIASGHANNQNTTIATGDFTSHNTFNYSAVSVGGTLTGGAFDFNTAIVRSQGSNPMVIGHAVGVEFPSSGTNFYGAAVGSFINCNAGVACAGTYTQAICNATNSKCWGDNPQVQDLASAFTGITLNGMEADVVRTNPIGQYTAITGMFTVLGSGSTAGSFGSGAVVATNNPAAKWAEGYRSANGCCVQAFVVGKTAGPAGSGSGVVGSQNIQFAANNGASDIFSFISTNSAGQINFLAGTTATTGLGLFGHGVVVDAEVRLAGGDITSVSPDVGISRCSGAGVLCASNGSGTNASGNLKAAGYIAVNLYASSTAPTIAGAGCGGSAATIPTSNGTVAFKINVGTAPGSACTITMPTATTGWNCTANDITTVSTSVFLQKQTGAESATAVTFTNFNDVASATAFVANDILKVTCAAD